jgi:HlyD family secretion protein
MSGGRAAAVVLGVLALSACGERTPPYFQGYAEGEYVRVALPFSGSLERLHVQRGTPVKVGDALFALERENEVALRREAEERLRNAEAQLANLQKGKRPTEIAAIKAQLAQAETSLRLSEVQLKRAEELVAQNFIAKERLDEARTTRDRDRERVAQLKADLATAGLAARADEIKAAQAAVAAAQATLAQADWRLAQKSATAPVAGLVTDTLFVKGEWVAAGAPVVNLLPPQNIRMRFFVPEPALGALRIGQKISASCDGCAAPVPATITFIAPQAEFTPPVIYSRDSRAKLVFLVEARPSAEDAVKLHPGQPLEVRVAQ